MRKSSLKTHKTPKGLFFSRRWRENDSNKNLVCLFVWELCAVSGDDVKVLVVMVKILCSHGWYTNTWRKLWIWVFFFPTDHRRLMCLCVGMFASCMFSCIRCHGEILRMLSCNCGGVAAGLWCWRVGGKKVVVFFLYLRHPSPSLLSFCPTPPSPL